MSDNKILRPQKSRFSKFLLYIAIVVSINFLYGAALETNDDIFDRINRNLDIFGKTFREVALNYVDELNIDKLMQASLEGMTGALDPYNVYYDENNKQELELITSGKYGGIGIITELKDSNIVISEVMSGYEAEKKGLKEGDIILEIDGKNVNGMRLEKFRSLVRGEPGSVFEMRVERNTEQIKFVFTRQEINLKNITYSGFVGEDNSGFGYIKLERFTMSAENEFAEAVKRLKSLQELKGLIIDLRGNGGGLLESSIGILSKFIEKNTLLLMTKGRDAQGSDKYFSKGDMLLAKDIPVVILVNKGTASASEILAGAVQDLDRGVIIGNKTFGKGLVQQIKDLNYGTKLKLTTKRYYTPSGRWIQEKDYFRENKSGVFINNNLYEQTEFKTLNGRIVYAHGGIMPDISIRIDSSSEISKALANKDMYFKFANFWVGKNPGASGFICSDKDFDDFKSFIYENNFSYYSEGDKKFDELEQIAAKKNYSQSFVTLLKALRDEAEREESSELLNAKEEIKREITKAIQKRIISQAEQIKLSLDKDTYILAALEVFKNRDEYFKLLNK